MDLPARRSNPEQNPTLRGRRLAMELQRRREATGMSREEVARQLEWSTSTIFRIETGRSRPQPGNVRTLLELYGVTGPERDGLIQLTREARQPGWWHSFRDVLPNPYEVYIGLEAGAASIRNFEPVVVPGLLQTALWPAPGCTTRSPVTTLSRSSDAWPPSPMNGHATALGQAAPCRERTPYRLGTNSRYWQVTR